MQIPFQLTTDYTIRFIKFEIIVMINFSKRVFINISFKDDIDLCRKDSE